MSKIAEHAALKALPNYPPETYADEDEYIEVESERRVQRAFYRKGYEQAEKDLTLTLEQVVKLDCLIMNMDEEGYNDGYKTRPFYEEVLRRFNEQRKK